MRIIHAIVRLDKQWISNQTDLIISLSELWASDNYQVKQINNHNKHKQQMIIIFYY